MAIRINGVDKASTINQMGPAVGAKSPVAGSSAGTKTNIGTYHMADNPNFYEPQRSNNFEFVVTGIDGILRAGALGTEENAYFENAQEVIRMSVAQCPIPHFEQGVISVRRGNSEIKYAGVPTFQSGQITLNDYIGADTKSVLMAWQNLAYNVRTEKVGLASDYKRDCTLIEYSPDYQVVRSWILHGCWISGLSEDAYNSDSTDSKRQIQATIQYDRAEIDVSGLE